MLRRLARAPFTYWRLGLLVLAAALIWVVHFDRWTLASWSLPTDYYIDAHETLARLQAASEGDLVPLRPQVIDRLGAPFGAHWNGYPTPDKPLMVLLGSLVHLVGLYAAANLGLLLAQVTSALAFYCAARWLRCRWEWAAAGALLFAYTYHTFHRGLAHFSLVFTWTIPLGLLAVWLVGGSKRLDWGRPGATLCLGIAAAFGASNPYNLFFWLQLMGWAIIFQAFGAKRRPNLQIGLVSIIVALLGFALVHAESWLHADDAGAIPLLARNYGGTERYALKAVEMFIPPPFHHWDSLAFFGHRYARWSEWRGEVFLPYLGLAGIAGFVWLAVVTVRRIIARRPLPGQALSLGWILTYAMLGGVTNLLALFAGFQIFRATNRAAIFVSAIVLFFLILRLSRLSNRWPRWVQLAAAAAVAALGVYDQIPRAESAQDVKAIEKMVTADRKFGAELEAALPERAMVFQLPVLGFPEVATPHQLNDYEHFRPYLSTHSLRFTYGTPKMRPRSRWQFEAEKATVPELVRQLEETGFSALYLNRKGYADRGEAILGELTRLGYTHRIESTGGNQLAVLLRSTAASRLPISHGLTLGNGWHLRSDAGVRWTHEQGTASFYNPYPYAVQVELKLTLQAVGPREVVLEHNDEVVQTIAVDVQPGITTLPKFELQPGVNRFSFHCDAPAVRLSNGPNQLRSFGLAASSIQLLPGAPTAHAIAASQ